MGDTHCLRQLPYCQWAEPIDSAYEWILRRLYGDAQFFDYFLRVSLQALADTAEAAAEA
ncbi:hypothetical protein GCM10010520_35130 [Rhizobium viscosum]